MLQRGMMQATKCTLGLIGALIAVELVACGGINTTTLHNPTAPAATPVSIAFHPAPASSVILSSSTSLTAIVSNDPAQAGVDWVLLCKPNQNCGTLNPLHTASGAASTYTPPPIITGNSQTFTIEAFATADHTKNLVAPITVTGFAGGLKGTYVFQTRGIDSQGTFQLAGVVILDGNGGVTGGEQTHSDVTRSIADPISGGSYSLGPDGRGTLTLVTGDQGIGQQGTENFTLVYLSSSQTYLATFDNTALPLSNETSSGTLELQTSQVPPQNGYAFAVTGIDTSLLPLAMGGVLNIDSPLIISGKGSVADEDDNGSLTASATISGALSAPDAYGALNFTLTPGFTTTPLRFTGYIVDPSHIRLIESDNQGSGTGFGCTAGLAIAQASSTGKLTSASLFAHAYVFEILGEDLSAAPTSLASLGSFSADASGNLNNGYNDEFLSGLAVEIGDTFTGTYTLDSTGTGRVDSSLSYTNNGAGPELIFYLTGNGGPLLVLDADSSFGSIGAGVAYPQAAAPFSFNGKYGLYFTQSSTAGENDATAGISVSGSAGTLSGVIDTEVFFAPQPDTALTGLFNTVPNSGRVPGSLTNTFFPSIGSMQHTLAFDFYLVDSQTGFFIETDSLNSGNLTLGSFSSRTPICPTCP